MEGFGQPFELAPDVVIAGVRLDAKDRVEVQLSGRVELTGDGSILEHLAVFFPP
jgi:hypothetical protein